MTIKTELRPSGPPDAPGILQLLEVAGLQPNLQPSGLHWKYWEPRGDWAQPRSFVIVRGSQIVAHAAIVPGYCAWGAHRFRVLHPVDWAARPGEAGAGVSVMKHIGTLADTLLAIGGSEQTQRILPHIGFRFAGRAIGYARPLRPLRMLRSAAGPLWKLPPRIARRVFWTLSAPRGARAGWDVEALNADEAATLESVLPTPQRGFAPGAEHGIAVLGRSQSSFCYALRCPVSPIRLFAVRKTGQMVGYFLLTFPPGQARIADCWINSSDVQDWSAMIQCAVRQARRHREAAELACRASDPTLQRALTACGFHPRKEESIQIRAGVTFPAPPATLRVQLIDDDSAYQHSGRPCLLS